MPTTTVSLDALHVFFLHPDYRYSYQANVVGRGIVWLTVRRQMRGLNQCTAQMYGCWLARVLLAELYHHVVLSVLAGQEVVQTLHG